MTPLDFNLKVPVLPANGSNYDEDYKKDVNAYLLQVQKNLELVAFALALHSTEGLKNGNA